MTDFQSSRRAPPATAGRWLALGLFLLGPALALAAATGSPPPLYTVVRTIPLGDPDRWDYLSFDPASRRVYVAHSNEITVVDDGLGKVIGHVTGIEGAHGVVVVPALHRGFADNGQSGTLSIFDPATLKVTASVPADRDSDAVAFDPPTDRIFVMNGDAQDASMIDAATGRNLANIPLGGEPEFAVSDGNGHLFVNITDKREIARIDTRAGKVDARWPIPDCERPHGLAIDTATHRLFSSCVNERLEVVNAENGKVVGEQSIGKGTDAAAFDPVRHRVFSSNGDGTLSVIAEKSADQYESLGNIKTAVSARTMTIDPATGRLFLVAADVSRIDAPSHPGGRPRYQFVPGSTKLLVLDPAS